MAIQLEKRLFTADEFQQMADAGILREDDRVELIDGEIVNMAAIGFPHEACVNKLNKLLNRLVPSNMTVSIQNSLRVNERQVVQPDVVLLRPREDDYERGQAIAQDALLVVEVSESTLRDDRIVKVPNYARAGIVEVWIVDLKNEHMEIYTHPENGTYRDVRHAQRGEEITLQALANVTLAVSDILRKQL